MDAVKEVCPLILCGLPLPCFYEPVQSSMATACAAKAFELLADCLHFFVPCIVLCVGRKGRLKPLLLSLRT